MDRISSLPDELLCHILAFFTTKEAALTSVLSKRWRDLFASVPNLDIDDSVFLYPEEGKREKEVVLQSFMDFVDRVLAVQGDSPIEKFSLKCQTGVDPDRVNRWICNVLQRGVCHMDLSIGLGHRYLLPSEVFVSRTLVELKIGSEFPMNLRPGHISLPMLKTLTLDSMWCYNGQLQVLLSACPALEELDIPNIRLSYGKEIVSSASLRTLTIDSSNFFHAFSFDTPSLLCLKYSELVAWDYPVVNLDNLVDSYQSYAANF
ncbi:PREDICTED: putative F-box/LRR-repeat protein At3g58880 [Camelina sativa]|uniref:F-box/LRR-repeat protein At3g58880 n=1 Tax=Camelina sativa TaxID=90675 RepID=A0ABM0Y8K4_CAMSA|nr:PREDICTED: putative F-box/LRR-repeat protein At3g58880 [Camelina sativa]